MQEHEYKARDKTVQKMSRDGLREENLRNKEEKGSPDGIRIPRFPAVRRKRNWILVNADMNGLKKNGRWSSQSRVPENPDIAGNMYPTRI